MDCSGPEKCLPTKLAAFLLPLRIRSLWLPYLRRQRAVSTIRKTCCRRDSASPTRRLTIRPWFAAVLAFSTTTRKATFLGNGINSQGYVPWAQSVSISGVNDALSQFDSAPGAAALPGPSTLSFSGVNPNLVVARSYQYSLGVQHELPQGMLLQVSYVGNLGRHILRGGNTTSNINQPTWTPQGFIPVSPNPNTYACPSGINAAAYGCAGGFAPAALGKDQIRPYLGYSNLGMALSDVNSNYNSLQISLTKRAGFVTAMVAYTYSKAMGDGGGAADAYNENPEPECPFTCLVSTAANPVVVTGGIGGVGGTQSGGVVESWKKFDYGQTELRRDAHRVRQFHRRVALGQELHGRGRRLGERVVAECDHALPERVSLHCDRHGSRWRRSQHGYYD